VSDIKEDNLNNSFREWTNTFTQKPISGKTAPKQLFSIEKNYLPCSDDYSLCDQTTGLSAQHFIYQKSTFASFLEVPVPPPRCSGIS
jgi:hypothetical protein